MARAISIWIVFNHGTVELPFTVKHECATWISRQEPSKTRRVLKYPDGNLYWKEVEPKDVTDEFLG